MTDVVGFVTGITAIATPLVCGLIWGLDRNKKWREVKFHELDNIKLIKIAEAKENSLGETKVIEMNEKIEKYISESDVRYKKFEERVVDHLLEK